MFLMRTGWKWVFAAPQEASSGWGDAALATSSSREGSRLLTPRSDSAPWRPQLPPAADSPAAQPS